MGDVLSHKRTGVVSDITRGTAKALTYTAFALTLTFGGTRLFSEARADPPVQTQPAGPKELPPPGSKEETTPKVPKPLDSELAKLKKVSLGELQKLADETCKKYDCFTSPEYLLKKGWGWSADVTNIYFPDGRMSVIASIGKDKDTREVENVFIVMVNGKQAAGTSLDELARLYKKATGEKLEFVRIAVEEGKDEDGAYVSISFIPVKKPNGNIEAGVPIESNFYYKDDGKVYGQPYQVTTLNVAQGQ